MKKFLILLLLAAAIYPYAIDYYRKHIANRTTVSVAANINDFAKDLSKDLPRKQGYLTYDSVAVSTGSLIFLMVDGLGVDKPLTKDEARERLNTWRPFLIDYTCRNRALSRALQEGVTNNVYFQFTIRGESVGYGKVIVTPENCY